MGKKRNKKAIIITAAVMLTGILLVLAGFFGDLFLGLFKNKLDYRNITPEDLGKDITADILVYYDNIDLEDKTLQFLGNINSDDNAYILFDVSGLSESDKNLYYSVRGHSLTVQGRLRAVDEKEFDEVKESLYRLFDEFILEHVNDPAKNYTQEEKDDLIIKYHQMLSDPLIPYCFEVSSVSSFDWTPCIPAGAVIFLVSLIVEICHVFKLKKKIVLPVVFGLMIIVPLIMFFDHIRTMMTVKKAGDGLYTMKNLECTDTQGMLDSGARSVNELLEWILGRHFYGAPNIFEENFDIGCAAFAAVTPDGSHLFGRNFDFPETDTILIYSHPDGCYESIGMADLGVFGIGPASTISSDSAQGRVVMVLTPYVIVDGINEKGLGAGILQLSLDETHQDNGKPDLPVFCVIRAILDKCASVDEALELIGSYDIHSDLETDYHLFITDRSGRYVVVEWLDGEMTVTEHPCCTNSIVAPGKYHDMGDPDDRLPAMETCLGTDLIITKEEAMAVLDKVHNKDDYTEWSCVYDLDDFSVSICLDADYGKVYTFRAEDLK